MEPSSGTHLRLALLLLIPTFLLKLLKKVESTKPWLHTGLSGAPRLRQIICHLHKITSGKKNNLLNFTTLYLYIFLWLIHSKILKNAEYKRGTLRGKLQREHQKEKGESKTDEMHCTTSHRVQTICFLI